MDYTDFLLFVSAPVLKIFQRLYITHRQAVGGGKSDDLNISSTPKRKKKSLITVVKKI